MYYKNSLKSILFFEILSFIGRHVLNSKPCVKKHPIYLNIGCGTDVKYGFVNADFFRPRFWRKKAHKIDWMLDLRYPLNCKDNLFEGVYSSHMLEHLYPDEVSALLKELYRIMKPGAIIRIVIPDLKKYIDFYNGNIEERYKNDFIKSFTSPCDAIHKLTQDWLHHSAWDFEELKRYLKDAEFSSIQEVSFEKSNDKNLMIDFIARDWESLYVEAIK